MNYSRTDSLGKTATGFPKTFLQSMPTTIYEPRSTFQGFAKRQEPVSTAKFAVNQGGHMIHYNTNGGGRDSYIYRNNGGFTKMQEFKKWPEVGSIQGKPSYPKNKPNPVMEAKTLFYRSNGTGRDSYIE